MYEETEFDDKSGNLGKLSYFAPEIAEIPTETEGPGGINVGSPYTDSGM